MSFDQRYDLLKVVIGRYDSYYHLSAVKASLLLTTNVLLLAGLVSEESGLRGLITEGGIARICLLVAAILSLVSTVFAVLVIASYVARDQSWRADPSTIFSASVANSTVEEYLDRVTNLDDESVVGDLGRLAHNLASGLNRKFRRINLSLTAFLGAILAVAVACGVSLL